ncbi:hypothetical protein F2P81_013257 [Scophthalmus maximus]|uniref:Uncharacterized protein n=1 Tax=Scophthalmus maximus TaxID=52904 RepID=A0A6A4SS46_SCOMX|nr:hypothetical protein F2P81_013257 [Scophthalmus maximus]
MAADGSNGNSRLALLPPPSMKHIRSSQRPFFGDLKGITLYSDNGGVEILFLRKTCPNVGSLVATPRRRGAAPRGGGQRQHPPHPHFLQPCIMQFMRWLTPVLPQHYSSLKLQIQVPPFFSLRLRLTPAACSLIRKLAVLSSISPR